MWAVGTERVKHRVAQGCFPRLTAALLEPWVEGGRGNVHTSDDFLLSAESLWDACSLRGSVVYLKVENGVLWDHDERGTPTGVRHTIGAMRRS
jgi:hypothetical protein